MKVFKNISIVLLLFNFSCGQGSSNGTCKLQCSNPVIANATTQSVRILGTGEVSVGCPVGSSLALNPYRRNFQIYTPLPSDILNSDGSDSLYDPVQGVPNISFEPVFEGLSRNACVTDESSGDVTGSFPNCSVDPWLYAGVITPQSEWCTDSCGIATVEVGIACFNGVTDDATLSISSGGLHSINSEDDNGGIYMFSTAPAS